jgi:membrane fusion protein, multidrug efflux system
MRVIQSLLAVFLIGITGCGPGDSDSGAGASQAQQEAPPVQVVAVDVVQSPVFESISLVGDLMANEMVEIQAEADGVIFEILFDEGQTVEKDQALFRLDDRKLEAMLAESQANFELSRITFERDKKLLEDKLISQQEFDQTAARYEFNMATLKLRQRQLRDTSISAPFAGTVGERQVSPGQVIRASQTLTWIVDNDPVLIKVNVPERFLGVVRQGQTINFEVNSYPGEKFTGDIDFISPYVDPETRTAVVKARAANPDGHLKPGMFINLQLILEKRSDALVIPEASLELGESGYSVMVVSEALEVSPRPVTVGVRMSGSVEIQQGLKVGEKVVVEGRQKLRPGSKVVLAPDSDSERYRTQITQAASEGQ